MFVTLKNFQFAIIADDEKMLELLLATIVLFDSDKPTVASFVWAYVMSWLYTTPHPEHLGYFNYENDYENQDSRMHS